MPHQVHIVPLERHNGHTRESGIEAVADDLKRIYDQAEHVGGTVVDAHVVKVDSSYTSEQTNTGYQDSTKALYVVTHHPDTAELTQE